MFLKGLLEKIDFIYNFGAKVFCFIIESLKLSLSKK